jgi:hypothetical protein
MLTTMAASTCVRDRKAGSETLPRAVLDEFTLLKNLESVMRGRGSVGARRAGGARNPAKVNPFSTIVIFNALRWRQISKYIG